MSDIVSNCRHPKEKSRGAMTLLFGSLIWLVVLLAIVGAVANGKTAIIVLLAFYAGFLAVAGLLAAALARAYALGHNLLLGERQLPHLHGFVVEGAEALGLKQVPQAFLTNSNGVFNAFARRMVGQRFIFLTAALVEAETDAQIRFIIGHELGHHAAGHLDWGKNFLRAPSRLVPLLYPAYLRSRGLTCDRIGAAVAGDVEIARTALQMLAGGCGRLNQRMDPTAFEAQEALVPPFSGFLLKFVATHPHTCLRVRELRAMTADRHTRMPRTAPSFSPVET